MKHLLENPVIKNLQSISEILQSTVELTFMVRTGSWPEKAIAGLSALGKVTEYLTPHFRLRLQQLGLKEAGQMPENIYQVLTLTKPPTETWSNVRSGGPNPGMVHLWYEGGVAIAAVHLGSDSRTLYLGENGSSLIWNAYPLGMRILIENYQIAFETETTVTPEFYGKDISKEVAYLAAFPTHRTVAIVGASGVGKSVLTRNILRALSGDRYLIVSFDVLQSVGTAGLTSLITSLGPTGLVIDDLDPTSYKCLEILESLHGRLPIFVTVMAEDINAIRVPGLRPGRIDEVIEMKLPTLQQRRSLLEAFCNEINLQGLDLELAAQETAGLSGAYLKELCSRLNALGIGELQNQVDRLRQFNSV